MIQQISDNIWKVNNDSNIYILKLDKEIIAIDAGNSACYEDVKKEIKEIIDPKKVSKVLLTHLHYDHLSCFDLFENAEFYAHKEAIKDFEKNSYSSILSKEVVEDFNVKLNPLPEKISGLEVIHTPGHTLGSVCYYLKEKKIMFSGDTLFFNDNFGRTDLPTSAPEKIKDSLKKISKYDIEILCPGHDY